MDKTKWFELWQYFNQEHNLLLLETEVQEIIEMVRRIDKDEKNTAGEMPPWMKNMDSMDIKPSQFGTTDQKLLHQTTEKRINFSKDKPLSKPLEEMMEQRSPTLCMNCQKPIIKDEASGGYWMHADVDILKDGNGYYCYKGNQVLKAEPEEWKWKISDDQAKSLLIIKAINCLDPDIESCGKNRRRFLVKLTDEVVLPPKAVLCFGGINPLTERLLEVEDVTEDGYNKVFWKTNDVSFCLPAKSMVGERVSILYPDAFLLKRS